MPDVYQFNSKEQNGIKDETMAASGLPFYIVGFGECALTRIVTAENSKDAG